MNDKQMQDAIFSFLQAKAKLKQQPLTAETPLITAGLLDSFETFEFVSFLETHFGVQFSDQDLATENFDTVSDVCRTVHRSMQRPGASRS